MTTEEPKDKFGNWRPWAHGLHRAGVRVHPIPACPFRHMLPLVRGAPAMPQGLLPLWEKVDRPQAETDEVGRLRRA